jgi:DNA-binding MarR family transcriptional regulator
MARTPWASLVRISLKKRNSKQARQVAARPCPWLTLSRTGSGLHVEDFLTFRLTRLSNALRTNLTKPYLEEFNVSVPEWRLLAMITRFSPLRFSELTSRSSMDKGQVSRTLRLMTKRGLIKMKALRQRGAQATEALAAPVVVSITAAGKALYKSVLPVARRHQAEILMTLNDSERVSLYQTLDRLLATIGDNALADDEGF